MIVVDASAMLELLLQTPLGTRVEARLFRDQDDFMRRTSWTSRCFKACDAWSEWVTSLRAALTR